MGYDRGDVVKGPDFFGSTPFRPSVCVHDTNHPFGNEEGIFVAISTTRRSEAIPLTADDFMTGGLPKTSYVNPWTVTTIKHADIQKREGVLDDDTLAAIVRELCTFVGHEC